MSPLHPQPETIDLADNDGTTVTVAPGQGGRVVRYRRRTRLHGIVDVLHASTGMAGTDPLPQAGCPVMFPIAGFCHSDGCADRYRWQGEERPMPIHGFAPRMRWTVIEARAFRMRLELTPTDATREAYPFEFRLCLGYELVEGALRATLDIENTGERPMPFSTGFHPYLRLPLTAAGRRNRCFVHLPGCREYWARPRGIEAGSDHDPRSLSALEPAAPARTFADLDSLHADVIDAESGLGIALDASLESDFRCLTLWSPQPDAPFYCVEPRTSLQDAFVHAAQGQLTVLAPGGVFRATMEIDLREVARV